MGVLRIVYSQKGGEMINIFKCPQCGYPQYCGCDGCMEFCPPPKDIKPWKWVDGEAIQCAGCGHTAHVDWWASQEFQQTQRTLATKGK